MIEQYNIGDFGEFKFIEIRKKKKKWFKLFAEVTSIESRIVELTDNDGFLYLPYKKDIESFHKAKKPC
jgi:hypothetical protein